MSGGRRALAGRPAGGPPAAEGELRLSADEVAELTERLLDRGLLATAEPAGIPLSAYLRILEGHAVPEAELGAALADVVRNRERRLSNALQRKAHELERMLLELLPRFDARYRSEVEVPLPLERGRVGPAPRAIRYRLSASRGELEVRAALRGPEGLQRLFGILVRGPRPEHAPGPAPRRAWLPWPRREAEAGRRVQVLDPYGASLAELLARSLCRDSEFGPAIGAVDFLNDLRFDG